MHIQAPKTTPATKVDAILSAAHCNMLVFNEQCISGTSLSSYALIPFVYGQLRNFFFFFFSSLGQPKHAYLTFFRVDALPHIHQAMHAHINWLG